MLCKRRNRNSRRNNIINFKYFIFIKPYLGNHADEGGDLNKTPFIIMVFGKGKQKNMKEISSKAAKAKHEKQSQEGELNPNWKNGISKDNYHYKKIQKERYPEKVRARELVHNAIRSGKLKSPNVCQDCIGTDFECEAHHEDYNQPLKVVWLCKYCHLQRHR